MLRPRRYDNEVDPGRVQIQPRQQGFCGTCRTRVLGDDVNHRDTLLTEPERREGMMLVCVSRAHRGEHLTLDL